MVKDQIHIKATKSMITNRSPSFEWTHVRNHLLFSIFPLRGPHRNQLSETSALTIQSDIRAASKKTIQTFQSYYPETLSRKFFVNVPVIMGWAFAAMKLIASKETVKKFTVLSYAEYLAGELGPAVPKEYGGEAADLDSIGETLALKEVELLLY
jgi:hypothetical protein